jgi:hypothetical protein
MKGATIGLYGVLMEDETRGGIWSWRGNREALDMKEIPEETRSAPNTQAAMWRNPGLLPNMEDSRSDSRSTGNRKDGLEQSRGTRYLKNPRSEAMSNHLARNTRDDRRPTDRSEERRSDPTCTHNDTFCGNYQGKVDCTRDPGRDLKCTEYRIFHNQDRRRTYETALSKAAPTMVYGRDGVHEVPVKAQGKNIRRAGPIKAVGKETVKKKAGKGTKDSQKQHANKKDSSGKVAVKERSPSPTIAGGGQLFVAIYDTRYGSTGANHWALFLRENRSHQGVISQAIGVPTRFAYDQIDGTEPERIARLARKELVGDVYDREEYLFQLGLTPIRNSDHHWNCQNWVMEALANLAQEGCIEREDHVGARKRLRVLMDLSESDDEMYASESD